MPNRNMKILFATNNLHKIEELNKISNQILNDSIKNKIEFISAKELNININPEENSDSFEGNAKIKAEAFFNEAKIPVLADDSGFEVEILNNLPGIYSARFAEILNCNIDKKVKQIEQDKANRKKVINLLKKEEKLKEKMNRNARFRTVLAFLNENKTEFFIGECKGKIIDEEMGENGFGYDSIFVPEGFDKTFAEMSSEEKNKISHRFFAMKNFCEFLNKQNINF